MDWDLIYDLAEDLDRIERSQRRTLTTRDGLAAEPAPIGTPEWWSAIEGGQLKTERVDGPISKVYWASMADWPEFAVDAQAPASTWTREGDITRYVEGLHVKLSFVRMRFKKPLAVGLEEAHVVLKTWIERSRLRSCDVVPGPGRGGFRDLTTLFRPVGDAELTLIERSGHRAFPPRLPEQPIFYPVLEEGYATKIARDWNTKDERSGFVGYVTAFHVRTAFLEGREIHEVGGRDHREYWIPAEELDDFNANLVGRIDVIGGFVGTRAGHPHNDR